MTLIKIGDRVINPELVAVNLEYREFINSDEAGVKIELLNSYTEEGGEGCNNYFVLYGEEAAAARYYFNNNSLDVVAQYQHYKQTAARREAQSAFRVWFDENHRGQVDLYEEFFWWMRQDEQKDLLPGTDSFAKFLSWQEEQEKIKQAQLEADRKSLEELEAKRKARQEAGLCTDCDHAPHPAQDCPQSDCDCSEIPF